MLDDAGLEDCKIMASNSLDEYTITSLLIQGGPIDDIFGVVNASLPLRVTLYLVRYIKLLASRKMVWEPRIKISEAVERLLTRSLKGVYRVYNDKGRAIADLLTLLERGT